MAEVYLLAEAVEDIAAMDGAEKRAIFKALMKLRVEPENRGAPLGAGLTSFRKLVVGNRQYRIVFRVEPSGDIAVVWVVAARVDSRCYELASARLRLYADRDVVAELRALLDGAFQEPK
jgi:mRNA interferase RelE/StbE